MGRPRKTERAKPETARHSKKPQRIHRSAPVMPIADICADPRNSRRHAITPENDPKLMELADSIKQFGNVIEPIVVRLRSEEDISGGYCPECRYILISGHRRLAAAKLAGLQSIHCSVWENLTDREAFEMQLVENLHRVDLLPTEEAAAYKRMKEELGYSIAEIALRVGKSEKHIGRYMRMDNLPDNIKESIDNGSLTLAKAQYLCTLPDYVLGDVLATKKYLLAAANYTADEFKAALKRIYIRELDDDIEFDQRKKYTDADGKEWPACTHCPHRDQSELFEEFSSKEKCPYATCFNAKEGIAFSQKKDADEEPEDDEELEGDEPEGKHGETKAKAAKYQIERNIDEAVDRAKFSWYADRLMERGIQPTDVFSDIALPNLIAVSYDELYLKAVGKNLAEMRENGTADEILSAAIISEVMDTICYKEEEVAEWLGCVQCPDEVLQAARNEAMGVNKK